MQFGIMKRVAVFVSKVTLMSRKNLNSTFFVQSSEEVSIVGREKTLNSEQMRYSIGWLKVNCSFTLEKGLKMTPN